MSTIYATPYNQATKQCTGPSTDSGFESLDQVAGMMGEPTHRSPRWVAYGGAGDEAVAYSMFVFHVDEPAINP